MGWAGVRLNAWSCRGAPGRAAVQQTLQRAASVRGFDLGHVARSSGGHDAPAAGASFGPEIDDPIGRFDHVEIVLDHDHGVAGVDKVVQHFEQQADVGKVQAGGRLVEQIERAAGALLYQLASELDPLGLAARQGGRRLAELEIVEPDVMERGQLVLDFGNVGKMFQRLLHVHFQHVGDRLALEADLQRLAIEAMPLADRAGDPHVGQKIHLQPVRAVSFARFAAAAGHVEAEPADLVAPGLRLGQLRVEIADLVEQLDVRGRIRTRRPPDRRLIDRDQFVEMLHPLDPVVIARLADAAVQVAAQGLDQNVVDQRALARA